MTVTREQIRPALEYAVRAAATMNVQDRPYLAALTMAKMLGVTGPTTRLWARSLANILVTLNEKGIRNGDLIAEAVEMFVMETQ